MLRKPIKLDRVNCFANFRDTDTCTECKHRIKCISTTDYFKNSITVAEWVNNLKEKAVRIEAISVEECFSFFEKEYKRIGGKINAKFRFSTKWRSALERVTDACNVKGVDSRLFIRAQVNSLGVWCIKSGKTFYPNMLLGENAQQRFDKWLLSNEKQYGSSSHLADAKWNKLIAAEIMFAELFFAGLSLSSAKNRTRIQYPNWSLKHTCKNTLIRFIALNAYLASLNSTLPRRVVVKSELWKYGTIKKELETWL